ncbi:MAG: glycosyltransferase family 2 protein [Acidobacteria bacterium]|nr:MAG: glycosyltransferase family 2 protein [Acidobacteriota bacterium]
MTRLTAIVLTGNCQDSLPGCLESLDFADEILVVDSGSSDRTREIALAHGARVLEHPLERFDEQRNWAQQQADTDWVLFVDSDERVPPELAEEIRTLLTSGTDADAYSMPRKNHFLGRRIRRCGWGSDRVTRLLHRHAVRWEGAVHEKPRVRGKVGVLRTPLTHHSYPSISAYWDKMQLYSRLAAAQDFQRGKRSGFLRMAFQPKLLFLRMYVLRGGWLEGRHGLVLCLLSAFSAFTRALRLWEHQLGASGRSLLPEGPPVEAPHQGGHPLSILVPTHNESANIEGVLDSTGWADEVLVVDSFSDDDTVATARRRADRVLQHEYINSAAQKNWALPQTRYPWAMVVDADERVTPELAREVRQVLASKATHQGYVIRRVNHFHGQRIRHCGWNRDRVLRLFNRERSRYQEQEVHADVEVDGTVSELRHPLLHFTFRNVDQYWPKIRRYTDWGSSQAYRDGQRSSLYQLVARPVGRFIKMYFLRLGMLDGTRGLVICTISFFSVFNKYAKLWEKDLDTSGLHGTVKTGSSSE